MAKLTEEQLQERRKKWGQNQKQKQLKIFIDETHWKRFMYLKIKLEKDYMHEKNEFKLNPALISYLYIMSYNKELFKAADRIFNFKKGVPINILNENNIENYPFTFQSRMYYQMALFLFTGDKSFVDNNFNFNTLFYDLNFWLKHSKGKEERTDANEDIEVIFNAIRLRNSLTRLFY